jgi:transcriptional regulator GlxA family with amidase domain
MHTVVVLALDGVLAFDLSTPVEIFGRARLPDGRAAYRVRVCAPADEVDAGVLSIRVPWGLKALGEADTVVVPGLADPAEPVAEEVLGALREAAEGGARVASICVGAFTLAAAGLLDGRRATTHWAAAEKLSCLYPNVEVDADVLFVDNGQILTSAVMPPVRDGGQAQFIVHERPGADGLSLEPLLRWMEENAHRRLTLGEISVRASTSTRTLNRRFREQTGTTPLRWLQRARIRRARVLLETTGHPVERIADEVGFGSPTSFRDLFKNLVGTSPRDYRRAFRSPPAR